MKTKRLVYPKKIYPESEYPEDIHRIVEVCKAQGYSISEEDAEKVWLEYSEDHCAGWLVLHTEDSMLFEIVKRYCCEVEIIV